MNDKANEPEPVNDPPASVEYRVGDAFTFHDRDGLSLAPTHGQRRDRPDPALWFDPYRNA